MEHFTLLFYREPLHRVSQKFILEMSQKGFEVLLSCLVSHYFTTQTTSWVLALMLFKVPNKQASEIKVLKCLRSLIIG